MVESWKLIVYPILTLLISWVVHKISKWTFIPGPWGLPVVGSLLSLNAKTPHLNLTELSKKYGTMYGLRLGSVYTVVLSDVKLIREVLAMEATTGRAPLHLTHGIMQGYGLICAQGALWKDQRKLLTTYLKKSGITKKPDMEKKAMETRVMEEVQDCIQFIKSKPILKANQVCCHNIGSIMNKLVFGMSYDREDKEWIWLQELQEEGVRLIGVTGVLNFLPFLEKLWYYGKTLNFLKSGQRQTHKIYEKILKEKRQINQQASLIRDKSVPCEPQMYSLIEAFSEGRKNHRKDFTFSSYYSDRQLLHLMADVWGAGLDTTVVTMSWFFLYMASNLDIQNELQEELDAVLKKGECSLDDEINLPFLRACISEAQRIRSVVPLGIPHGTLNKIEINGYTVPQGTMIIPLLWAVHMSEDYWDEPEKFNPRRFINEEGTYFKPKAFIPFQTGKRMCPGDELAKWFLLLFLGNIMHQFRVESEKEVDLEGEVGITLTPMPQDLIFTPRF